VRLPFGTNVFVYATLLGDRVRTGCGLGSDSAGVGRTSHFAAAARRAERPLSHGIMTISRPVSTQHKDNGNQRRQYTLIPMKLPRAPNKNSLRHVIRLLLHRRPTRPRHVALVSVVTADPDAPGQVAVADCDSLGIFRFLGTMGGDAPPSTHRPRRLVEADDPLVVLA